MSVPVIATDSPYVKLRRARKQALPHGRASVRRLVERNTCSRTGESGFALLLVFAMAGAIAIMLYSQMPRVAFEAQRDKEELLIQRGEEYVRAIQLFVSKYP